MTTETELTNQQVKDNNFKHSDLFRLKSEIDKMLKSYNHDNHKTTTYLRRPFAHHALSN